MGEIEHQKVTMEEEEVMVKVARWACGTMCEEDEIAEHLYFMSDDYEVVEVPYSEYCGKGVE